MSDVPSPTNGRVSPTAVELHPELAGFKLVRLLGRGGLGEVYEALAADGTTVAVKTFLLRGDDQGLVAGAFVREANTGRRLDHPNIVRVITSGCHGDYAYLAMEFVPGGDLRAHTRSPRLLSVRDALDAVHGVALALAAAHRSNVVHRDIKPSNVLVHWPTRIFKVADFGLARLGDAFRSRTGVIAGTPAYMSPEQLAEGPIGPASDLYALGVVLFELLCGRLPHEARSFGELLTKISSRPAPSIATLRPGLPAPLCGLVDQLLERRADLRPADAGQVAEQVQAIIDTLPPNDPEREDSSGPKSRG